MTKRTHSAMLAPNGQTEQYVNTSAWRFVARAGVNDSGE